MLWRAQFLSDFYAIFCVHQILILLPAKIWDQTHPGYVSPRQVPWTYLELMLRMLFLDSDSESMKTLFWICNMCQCLYWCEYYSNYKLILIALSYSAHKCNSCDWLTLQTTATRGEKMCPQPLSPLSSCVPAIVSQSGVNTNHTPQSFIQAVRIIAG